MLGFTAAYKVTEHKTSTDGSDTPLSKWTSPVPANATTRSKRPWNSTLFVKEVSAMCALATGDQHNTVPTVYAMSNVQFLFNQ